mmetsp:Transcript_26489/g.44778  ORF Transcript_26489/g.44778 Transcript_26489/m.44778 type:complete len:284 (+) Transcript_26489:757-1608(+)
MKEAFAKALRTDPHAASSHYSCTCLLLGPGRAHVLNMGRRQGRDPALSVTGRGGGHGHARPTRHRRSMHGRSPGRDEEAAEYNVLHHGQLVQHLAQVQLVHAILDGLPVAEFAHGVQHGRRLVERSRVLDALDGLDALQVVVVGGLGPHQHGVVDVRRGDIGVVQQLAGAPHVDEAVVVIEAPHPVAACRLQVVDTLQLAHHLYVDGEGRQHEGAQVSLAQQSQLEQTQAEDGKVRLVPGAVVNSQLVAEGIADVTRELGVVGLYIRGAGGQQRRHKVWSALK